MTSSVLARIRNVEGIEWAAGFGPAIDTQNAALTGGPNIPLRAVYSTSLEAGALGISISARNGNVVASETALHSLGMLTASGAVRDPATGSEYPVVAQVNVPQYLSFLQPLLLEPKPNSIGPVNVLVVVTRNPNQVAAVTAAVQSVLGVDDPSAITVATSAQLADLRSRVGHELAQSGWLLVTGLLAVSGVLVSVVLFSLVALRRREFGRRRALGASRTMITTIVLAQTVVLAVAGGTLGAIFSAAFLLLTKEPLPTVDFFVATVVIACATAIAAALGPAILASRRDPVRELRVP
jgi:putative ABC transport system permease protein